MGFPLLPPSTLGVVGGGQLGMMTIREAQRMGYRSVVWDTSPDCPASRLADETIAAPFDDMKAAEQFSALADAITYEFENIRADTIAFLETRKPVRPSSSILRISQHRRKEKEELVRYGFPVAPFSNAPTADDVVRSVDRIGLPVVVKTATSGYDGKGQVVIKSTVELQESLRKLSTCAEGYVVEKLVALACELSVIVARTDSGAIITFPVCENEHRENILHTTVIPARVSASLQREAEKIARGIAEALHLVGVLCVEMFVTTGGTLLVNELAPRPHNSGHYTLDACTMSQFEAQVRAVCGLPLPVPRLLSPCAMINLLGKHLLALDTASALKVEGAKLHLYGKTRVEPKRKMGHITVTAPTPAEVQTKLADIEKLIGEPVSHRSSEPHAFTQQEKN